MSGMIFVNLPVADVARSQVFYQALGFSINEAFSNADGACVVISPQIYVMILQRDFFRTFTALPVSEPSAAVSSLFALSCEGRGEVNAMMGAALASGGGEPVPELADFDETENEKDAKLILPPSAAQVSRHLAALQWQADYLCPDHIGSARVMGFWAVSKARNIPFDRILQGRVSRAHAIRLKDRGLSLISQGLARDGVPVDVK